MAKYTNARYPDKINDLIDNNGNINPEVVPDSVFVWNTEMLEPISDTKTKLDLKEEDFFEIATKQPLKVTMNMVVPDKPDDVIEINLVYKKLIENGIVYNGHAEEGMVYDIEMYYDADNDEYIATLAVNEGEEPGTDISIDFGDLVVGDSPNYQPSLELYSIIREMISTEEYSRENISGVLHISEGSDMTLHYEVKSWIDLDSKDSENGSIIFDSSFGTIEISMVNQEMTIDLTNFLNPFEGGGSSETKEINLDPESAPGLENALMAIFEKTYQSQGLKYVFSVQKGDGDIFTDNDELFTRLRTIAENMLNATDDDSINSLANLKINYWLDNLTRFTITNFRITKRVQRPTGLEYTLECDFKIRNTVEYGWKGIIDTALLLTYESGEDDFYHIIIDNTYGLYNLSYESQPL